MLKHLKGISPQTSSVQTDKEANLDSYDYALPPELIAQEQVFPRDSSRLLVLHREQGRWEHRTFRDLPDLLTNQDCLVANNTKVLKARLLGHRILNEREESGIKSEKRGGKMEALLLRKLSQGSEASRWECLFHASGRAVPGFQFEIPTPSGRSVRGKIVRGASESPSGTVEIVFDLDPVESGAGEIPLPKYIDRRWKNGDHESYQTLYAKNLGSAAAPTAGLHFTPQTFEALRAKGIPWQEITLHVGIGTFRPVQETDVRKHVMHEEHYEILPETAHSITEWKKGGGRILAVGTTSVRTLESAWKNHSLQSGSGKTSIFIRPGAFEFQVVDRLLTNFHLPKSTLLMLVSAFAGRELVLAAYEEAVREKYRFFSYGDAMLIL